MKRKAAVCAGSTCSGLADLYGDAAPDGRLNFIYFEKK
jgi:hypothetical protein